MDDLSEIPPGFRFHPAVEEQGDWYFFSHKDRKYPTGSRTNRATAAGFWKATGRDKPIYSKHTLIGMRKTLVYYRGRAPNGQKSDWIIHEYRLESDENAPPQEEGWVVCRVFKKRSVTATQRLNEHEEERIVLNYFPQESIPVGLPWLENPGHVGNGTTDWRILDRLVASQLGQEEVFSKESNSFPKQEAAASAAVEYPSPWNPDEQIDQMWK